MPEDRKARAEMRKNARRNDMIRRRKSSPSAHPLSTIVQSRAHCFAVFTSAPPCSRSGRSSRDYGRSGPCRCRWWTSRSRLTGQRRLSSKRAGIASSGSAERIRRLRLSHRCCSSGFRWRRTAAEWWRRGSMEVEAETGLGLGQRMRCET